LVIWYIIRSFGTFSPFFVCCTKKNLAALFRSLALASPDDVIHFHKRENGITAAECKAPGLPKKFLSYLLLFLKDINFHFTEKEMLLGNSQTLFPSVQPINQLTPFRPTFRMALILLQALQLTSKSGLPDFS
jgi:hypothetical protein